jgi:hypothetical protein
MEYFLPDIDIHAPAEATYEKLGGLPVGLPAEKWPVCGCCGELMHFVGQFRHEPSRLSLGRAGRILYVFQCSDTGGCSWNDTAEATVGFVLEPEDVLPSVTDAPAEAPEPLMEAFGGFAEDVRHSVSYATKMGSVPGWLQSSGESPAGYRFLGQITEHYDFYRAPDESLQLEHWQTRAKADSERTYEIEVYNFGAGGIAYLFCEDSETDVPKIHCFWQC